MHSISFFLNGKRVTVDNPSIDTLLIDYLRSPEVHLCGPKKPCGQGGCGGCTVIVSQWNAEGKTADHLAINSCLRPLVAVDGMVVTTVEGTGAARKPNPEYLTHSQAFSRAAPPADQPLSNSIVKAQVEVQEKREQVSETIQIAAKQSDSLDILLQPDVSPFPSEVTQMGMNPVALCLAMNNGTQCGYCTVGFVMNMSEFIANNPKATKKEIEDIFDGNVCRCTGYRPILTGMKTFASDWTAKDEKERMKCLGDDAVRSQLAASSIVIPFPPEARKTAHGVSVDDGTRKWINPVTLTELTDTLKKYKHEQPFMVHANTGYGIYKSEFLDASIVVDLRNVPELNFAPVVTAQSIKVSSGTTYSSLIKILEGALQKYATHIPKGRDPETMPWGAALFMAKRTAGRIVRNAASVGGNTMLVLKHIAAGEPFPSDLLTALTAANVKIDYIDPYGPKGSSVKSSTVGEIADTLLKNPKLAQSMVLLAFHIPFGTADDVILAQKVALRDVNSHSIVNSAIRIETNAGMKVNDVRLVFGGLAPYPWQAAKTEKLLSGKVLTLQLIPDLIASLTEEVKAVMLQWKKRLHGLPDEGFTDDYKVQLAVAFFYKAIIKTLIEKGVNVPPGIRSSALITWGRWPVSNGLQYYEAQEFKAPLSKPYIKFTAVEQASGQLHYTHELPVPPGTVYGSLVQSRKSLANYYFTIPGQEGQVTSNELRDYLSGKFDSFIDLINYEVFKDGGINMLGMGADQPVFSSGEVNYVGQCIAMIGADSEQHAEMIADYVTDNCVGYTAVNPIPNTPDWWSKPILSLKDAIDKNSIYPDYPEAASFVSHIWKITRPGSQLEWVKTKNPVDEKIVNRTTLVDGNICAVVESTQLSGGQAHFYMETQAVIAEPVDGKRTIIRPSSQSPMGVHSAVAMSTAVQYNSIDVRVSPVGGAFGGKTEQSNFVFAAAAVASKALKRPVRLILSREQDTGMIGKRHAYYSQYQIAIDKGETTPANKGLLRGLSNKMYGDGGAFYDCSFIVSNCIITRADNAYRIANFQAQIDVCRTNTSPSTAFRAFGDIQGKIMLENAIDDAAFSIGMTAEEVREKNLYDRGDVTPFGQALTYCYMKQVWKYLKEKTAYDSKVKEVAEYNKQNKWRKRGLSIIPVKYGSGYNLTLLEQSGAMVSIYQGDGSIIVHQGGVEMGQGLLTQIRQVASYILNVPMTLIEVLGPKTSIIPNPTSTGASTGTSYNAEAVKRVCEQLRSRLMDFGYEMLKQHGNEWCQKQGIDFWNHGILGWRAEPGGSTGKSKLIWQNLVSMAFQNRISLTCNLNMPITGGETPTPNLSYKPNNEQPKIPGYISKPDGAPGAFDSFSGFTYSAACSVVEVDILTGETKILSSDIVYDIGWSMNPALDVGQVEGAFVQGIGYVLTEKLAYEPEGPDAGRLNTLNTWTYKPPATSTIPLEMNVHLFPRNNPDVVNIPQSPSDIMSAKEVGEPPLVLAASVFFAIKAAVRASRIERKLSGLFKMDSPATVQEVREACEVSNKDF
ncbi:MAG: molybdopterin cofactor-binding domain-containing protein [Mucilaginibacter sp.]|uniref:molybdopterin cofactor-binding domain-containing protein n=1 Tax=Mucilaginibacter sp. TaxID=1882438 RepID=UPI003266DA64